MSEYNNINLDDNLSEKSSCDSDFGNLLKGTEVVLVDSDSPWFLNKKLNVAPKYIPNNFNSEFNNDNPYKENHLLKQAKYKTNVTPEQQNKLIYQPHSLLERKLVSETKENFDYTKITNDKMNRNILIGILIIIIFIYIYKRR